MEHRDNVDLEAEKLIQNMYEHEYEKLIRCAISYLNSKSKSTYIVGRAEDVVQEMFALAWQRREEVLSSKKPVGWLYNALYFKAKSMLKEENRWTKRLMIYEQYYVQAADPYIAVDLRLTLVSLVPKEDFNLLRKFYIEGYSYRELCRETGLTKSALGVRIRRIKDKIQEQLEE